MCVNGMVRFGSISSARLVNAFTHFMHAYIHTNAKRTTSKKTTNTNNKNSLFACSRTHSKIKSSARLDPDVVFVLDFCSTHVFLRVQFGYVW